MVGDMVGDVVGIVVGDVGEGSHRVKDVPPVPCLSSCIIRSSSELLVESCFRFFSGVVRKNSTVISLFPFLLPSVVFTESRGGSGESTDILPSV